MKKINLITLFSIICILFSCAKAPYEVRSVESARIAIDSTWDAKANPKMLALVESYKKQLDSEMNVEIGTAAQTLEKGFPQSLLSNFTADAMKETANQLWSNVDFAVMNMGGLRVSLNKGPITIGSMYETYPFENQLVLLELQGKDVRSFFEFVAFNGGEGLSNGVRLVVKNRAIESLEIGGKSLDENKIYRIATIDFLAAGNDHMEALTQAVRVTDSGRQLRDFMIDYVKNLTLKKQEVNAKLDDRITIR
ncbi:MAG: 5'-nucleotidase C-terminal domain-containing protein [Dysgonamonadaceae bacterium]|jgi:2',3'-cyclic-nucleotide 2'-phosphodiesterase (5'-nucleotidase family)|nr:5'-nucleotidase C-terminal domain-containing protein [Dysgonamonadaceae bacterium]